MEIQGDLNNYDQILFASVNQAFEMGAVVVGATVYFGSEERSAVDFRRTPAKVYTDLTSDHPIDLTRYQVINCFLGRAGLINSGGSSSGKIDLAEVVRTANITKRSGGMGLISGCKAFQRPVEEGVRMLNAIQDVYRSEESTAPDFIE